MNDILFENEHYIVRVNATGDGYICENKETRVIESTAEALPECIFAAENLNVAMVHKTWEWIGKQAASKAAKAAGIELAPVSELH